MTENQRFKVEKYALAMHLQCKCNANAMHLHKTTLDYQRVTPIKFLSSQKNYVFMCIFALREYGAGEK